MPCTILRAPSFQTYGGQNHKIGSFNAVAGQQYRVTVSFCCDCLDPNPGFYYGITTSGAARGLVSYGVVDGRDWQGGGSIGVITGLEDDVCNLILSVTANDLGGIANVQYFTAVVETVAQVTAAT